MKLSVVIVSWNEKDSLKKTLDKLFKSEVNFEYEVFVVDNNSEDETASLVKKHFPQVVFVDNEVNFGPARARNQIVRHLESDYVLYLNPGVLLGKETLQKQVDYMDENNQVSLSACKMIDKRGNILLNVRKFPGFLDQAVVSFGLEDKISFLIKKYRCTNFDFSKSTKIDSVVGGFFMINLLNINDLKMYLDRTLPEFDSRFFYLFSKQDYAKQIEKSGGETHYTSVTECVDENSDAYVVGYKDDKKIYFKNSLLKYFERWHGRIAHFVLSGIWIVKNLKLNKK